MTSTENDYIFIDCSKLACPEPVLRCRSLCQANTNSKKIIVIVDNPASKENVSRFLSSQAYNVTTTIEDDKWKIEAEKDLNLLPPLGQDNKSAKQEKQAFSEQKQEDIPAKTLVILSSDLIGSGDAELGAKLMLNFLNTLPELGADLWRIIALNGAVRLTVDKHPALEKLKALEENGVDILVCGTCLEHFKLLEAKKVGQTTNMLDVVTSLQLASKVIHF